MYIPTIFIQLLSLVLFLIFLSIPGFSAVFNVTNEMEFQNALTTAQSNGDDDTINLAAGTYDTDGMTFTYVAAMTEDFSLAINGADAETTILDGGDADQILNIDMTAIPDETDSDLVITNLTFQNANSATDGGGIFLDRTNVIFDPSPSATIMDCRFISNNTTGDGGGFSIEGAGGIVTISDNLFIDNTADGTGAGMEAAFGTVTLENNTFDNNAAGEEGGGADVSAGGQIGILINNVFTNNSSMLEGGGANVSGGSVMATLDSNVFMNNGAVEDGGGVHISGGGATADLQNNIFIDNTAGIDGGGANIRGGGLNAEIINNTFTLNSATENGGGVNLVPFNDGDTVDMYNNIIFDNSAGVGGDDIFLNDDNDANDVGATLNLFNNDFVAFTSLCENTPPCVPNINEGDNISEVPLFVDANDGDVSLFAGSPAIDSGDNPNCPAMDQRGENRPQDGDDDTIAVCDMGAIEMLLAELMDPSDGGSGCSIAKKQNDIISLALLMLIPALMVLRRVLRKN